MFMDSGQATSSDPGSIATGIFFVVLGGFVYVIPILIARSRNTINKGAVAVVTVLLGWTCIGWIIALAMAAGGATQEQMAARTTPAPTTPSAPVISPDGRSWWDGQQWRPLPTARPAPPPRPPTVPPPPLPPPTAPPPFVSEEKP